MSEKAIIINEDLNPNISINSHSKIFLTPTGDEGVCGTSFVLTKNWKVAILSFIVLTVGVANAVTGKIMTQPMGDFSLFLGVFNALMYNVVYFSILGVRVALGYTPKEDVKWVWTFGKSGNFFARLPPVKYLVLIGLLDGVGQLLDLMTRPHVSGPLIALLPQGSLFYNMIVSAIILKDRFTYWQLWAVLIVVNGVIVTIAPQIGGNFGGEPIFIILTIIYPIFSSISFALKELLFRKRNNLDVFIVNSHNSMFQFLLQPVFIPISFLLNPNQTNGQPLDVYLRGAFQCFAGHTPSWLPHGRDCSPDPWPYVIYIVINIVFNITVLVFVKEASMVITFLVMKTLLPLQVMSFYIKWPIIPQAPFSPWHVAGLVVILFALGVYRVASHFKNKHNLPCFSPEMPCCCPSTFNYKALSSQIE